MAPEQDRTRPELGSPASARGLVFLLPALAWIGLRVVDLAGAGLGSVGGGLGRLWTALPVASASIIAFALFRTLSRS